MNSEVEEWVMVSLSVLCYGTPLPSVYPTYCPHMWLSDIQAQHGFQQYIKFNEIKLFKSKSRYK